MAENDVEPFLAVQRKPSNAYGRELGLLFVGFLYLDIV